MKLTICLIAAQFLLASAALTQTRLPEFEHKYVLEFDSGSTETLMFLNDSTLVHHDGTNQRLKEVKINRHEDSVYSVTWINRYPSGVMKVEYTNDHRQNTSRVSLANGDKTFSMVGLIRREE